MTRTEFRFTGFGGQGVITMAHILGHAASLDAGMYAVMTEAYGPEKTGGFSRGDVVVSDEPIDYPGVVAPNVMVAFAQDAFERDADSLAENGVLIVEWNLVDPSRIEDERPDVQVIRVPAVELAQELGRKVVANIVMLGAAMSVVDEPPADAVRDAVAATVPAGTEELNDNAFERGLHAFDEPQEVSQ